MGVRKSGDYHGSKRSLGVAPAIVVALSAFPSAVSAQNDAPAELPSITVISPTPLAGTRSQRPQKPKAPATTPRGRTATGAGTSTATTAPVSGTAPSDA